MKRITVLLPDDLAYLLERERRRGVSTAAIVREAIAAHFNVSSAPRHLPFAALGRSGLPDMGEHFEEYLAEEWRSDEFIDRTMGRDHQDEHEQCSARTADAPADLPSADAAPDAESAANSE